MIILAELQPLDTVAGTRKTLRASSANDPAVTGLNSVIWRPAISEEASIGIRLFKGDFDGEAAPTGGSLSIEIDQWLHIEANARSFRWAGAPIKLYAGVSGQAWPWNVVFDGLVEGFTSEKNTVKLQFKVNTEPFDADVLTLKYAGTGGAEGGTDLKDKVKPFLLGRCFNVEPVLINSVDNVFQFSGYGAIQAVNVLYERGSDFGPSMGNYTTYANLVAATIPPGHWATCLAQGMVRLGAPAYGVITADVDGDNVGGWWRKTGEIIQRVASNSAVSGSLIESASFTALDTALAGLSNQGRIGVFIDTQETVLEFASRLAAPCNAQVGVSLAGKLFVGRIAIGSPTITLDAQQRRLPRVTSSVESSVQPPFSYLEMGYARSWRVHSVDEIAGFESRLTVRFPEAPPEIMQEGGIYIDATNKQFRYIGPTVFSDEGDAFSDEGLITSSGYEEIQDLAIIAAQEAATAAANAAATAQAAADAANAAIALIDDDDIITISEKVEVLIPGAAAFEALYTAVLANATAASISVTTLNTKRTAWLAALSALSPAWNNTSVASPVVRGSLDTARNEYDTELKTVQRLSIEAMTAAKQVTASLAADKAVPADYLGVVSSDNLAALIWAPSVIEGGSNIKGLNTTTYAISGTYGGTFAVDNTNGSSTKGNITTSGLSAITAGGVLTISVNGVALPTLPFKVEKSLAAAPAPPSGTDSEVYSSGDFSSLSGTSYVAISTIKTLTLASGQSLYGTAALDYTVNGNVGASRTLTAKWQYAVAGSGSWNDFAAGVAGSTAIGALSGGPPDYEYIDGSPGFLSLPQTKSGLGAGDYDVRIVGLLNTTGRTVTVSGSALMEAKT